MSGYPFSDHSADNPPPHDPLKVMIHTLRNECRNYRHGHSPYTAGVLLKDIEIAREEVAVRAQRESATILESVSLPFMHYIFTFLYYVRGK